MVSIGLIAIVATGALLAALGVGRFARPAAKETKVIVDDLKALKRRLPSSKPKEKAEKEAAT